MTCACCWELSSFPVMFVKDLAVLAGLVLSSSVVARKVPFLEGNFPEMGQTFT